jgi:hypothetical protein
MVTILPTDQYATILTAAKACYASTRCECTKKLRDTGEEWVEIPETPLGFGREKVPVKCQ